MDQTSLNCLPPGQRPDPDRHYDVGMIRDFLCNLLWELRLDHNAWAGPGAGAGKAPSLPRRDPSISAPSASLLPPIILKGEERLSPDDRLRVRARMAALRQQQIEALETLLVSPIADVLRHSGSPSGVPPVLEIEASRLLDRDTIREVEGS